MKPYFKRVPFNTKKGSDIVTRQYQKNCFKCLKPFFLYQKKRVVGYHAVKKNHIAYHKSMKHITRENRTQIKTKSIISYSVRLTEWLCKWGETYISLL